MEKDKLTVVSYNIHKGFNAGNGKYILEEIRDALRGVEADLIFLQEVLGHHEVHGNSIKDWPTQSQFEYLSHEIWPHYAYGKNAVYTDGHHGNAILSKYPLLFFENIDVSTNIMEKRGLLHGVIDIPWSDKPLHAICVHLGLFESERSTQVRSLCDRIENHISDDEPLIIGGDFNDWRGRASGALSESHELQEAFQSVHGIHARTFPSWLPALRLDRIYYRGLNVMKARCLNEEPWNQLSDHAALVAELAF